MNIGFIKAVRPEIDLSKIDSENYDELGALKSLKKQKKQIRIEGLIVKLKCEFCGGPIHGIPSVLKFASFERFFCCTQCRASYNDKHSGRIEMLKEQYRKR